MSKKIKGNDHHQKTYTVVHLNSLIKPSLESSLGIWVVLEIMKPSGGIIARYVILGDLYHLHLLDGSEKARWTATEFFVWTMAIGQLIQSESGSMEVDGIFVIL